jgi:DNA transformation protein
MSEPKGYKLFVNLGATQTRRRLKGFGHGVRKVFSMGLNRAYVIHTATGRHLDSLKAQFDDVGYAETEKELGEPIENLRNLGSTSAEALRSIGVRTIADLRTLGPVTAYRLVKEAQPGTSLNLLWSLHAGLHDMDWRDLSEMTKTELQLRLRPPM